MIKKFLILFAIVLSLGSKAQNIALEPKQDIKKQLWGYVNGTTGNWVVKPTYNTAESFKNGADGKFKALVTKGNLKGYIGPDGKPLGAGIVFETMEPLMEGDNQIVSVKGKKGVIAPDALYIIKPEISDISPLGSEGYIVTVNGKMGVLSPEGKYTVQPIYESVKPVDDDVFIVHKGGKAGILSRKGEMMLVPSKYDDVNRFGNYWKIKKGDKVGVFDPAKRVVVVPADYADVMQPVNFPGGFIYPVKKGNGKWGAVDGSGKEIISCKNQALTPVPALNAIRVYRNNVGERLYFPARGLYLELDAWNDREEGPFRLIRGKVDVPSERTPDNLILGLSFAEHMSYRDNYRARVATYNDLGPQKSFQILTDNVGNVLGTDGQIRTFGTHWLLISGSQPWKVYDAYGNVELETPLRGTVFNLSDTWISDGRYILYPDLNVYPIKRFGNNLGFIDKGENAGLIPLVDGVQDVNAPSFDEVEALGPNLVLVKKDGKWGLYSDTQLLPCLFDNIKELDRNGWLEVKHNSYVGIYSPYAKRWIISPESKVKSYEFYNFSSYSPILIYNGKWGLVSDTGQIRMPMTSTKEEILKQLTNNYTPAPKNNSQPRQNKPQTPKEKKTKTTEFQESKEKRRF